MFTKYENGAEVDIEEVARYDKEAGLEVEAEGVYKYDPKIGAEVEVWSGQPVLEWLEGPTYSSTGASYLVRTSEGHIGWSVSSMSYGESDYITYYTEGNFVDPWITIDDVSGSYEYENNSGETKYRNGGILYLYTRTTDGVENYTQLAKVGDTSGWGYSGYVEKYLTGEYDRIGLKFYLYAGTTPFDNVYRNVTVEFPMLNGKLWLPSEDCVTY